MYASNEVQARLRCALDYVQMRLRCTSEDVQVNSMGCAGEVKVWFR